MTADTKRLQALKTRLDFILTYFSYGLKLTIQF